VSLRNRIEQLSNKGEFTFFPITDSVYKQQYIHTSAEVINNSVNKQNNFFTVNKGTRQGLKVDMAVSSQNNVAGMIVRCSENYSVAMSVINIDFRLSARIKMNGYFGSLTWDGKDPRIAVLGEIPQHVS